MQIENCIYMSQLTKCKKHRNAQIRMSIRIVGKRIKALRRGTQAVPGKIWRRYSASMIDRPFRRARPGCRVRASRSIEAQRRYTASIYVAGEQLVYDTND